MFITILKVLQINTGIFPVPPLRGGGTEQYVYEITSNLSSILEYVYLISDISNKNDFKKNVQITKINSLKPSLNTGFIGWVFTHFFGGLFSTIVSIKKLFHEKYHIIHIHSRFNGYFVCMLKKLFKKKYKVVYTLHNSGPWLCKYESKLEEVMQKIVFLLFDVFVIKNSDKTIVLSKKMRKELLYRWNINDNKISVIYNGVNSKIYRSKQNYCKKELLKYGIKNNYILFVGQLHPRKGLFYLIKAMRNIDFLCVVVGVGPQKDYLMRYIDKNKINNIKFTGSVSRKTLICLYKGAKLFVLPSTAEALPLTILEAMAAGLPIISTNIGAIPEIINNGVNGFIVEPYNSKKLEKAIKKILWKDKIIKSINEVNKKKASKEFDWSSVIKKIYNLYWSILK